MPLYYKHVVKVNNVKEANIINIDWSKRHGFSKLPKDFLDNFNYPIYLHLINKEVLKYHSPFIESYASIEPFKEYVSDDKVITFKEYETKYLYKPSKNLRQLKFESFLNEKEENVYKYIIKANNEDEVKRIHDFWAKKTKLRKWKGTEHSAVPYPKLIFVVNPENSRIRENDFSVILQGFYTNNREIDFNDIEHKKLLTIDEFMKKEGNVSRYVKQLKFESVENRKFKVGDRVIRVNKNLKHYGEKATVKGYHGITVIIEFDKKIGVDNNTYKGLTKSGYGWSCNEVTLEKINDKIESRYVRQLKFENFIEEKAIELGQEIREDITKTKKRIIISIKNATESRAIQNFFFKKKLYWCDGQKTYYKLDTMNRTYPIKIEYSGIEKHFYFSDTHNDDKKYLTFDEFKDLYME